MAMTMAMDKRIFMSTIKYVGKINIGQKALSASALVLFVSWLFFFCDSVDLFFFVVAVELCLKLAHCSSIALDLGEK